MKMIYNVILDSAGYKPVTNEDMQPAAGISWHNWLTVEQWEKNGKLYTTDEALEEQRAVNGLTGGVK